MIFRKILSVTLDLRRLISESDMGFLFSCRKPRMAALEDSGNPRVFFLRAVGQFGQFRALRGPEERPLITPFATLAILGSLASPTFSFTPP